MSGIFFTWTNAVKPGIGKLDNITYLNAFKSMNKVILNPLFFIVFILPILTIPISTFLSFDSTKNYVFELLLISSIIYFTGVFLVTVLGNIPLNELLDRTDLNKLSQKELDTFRKKIENRWNKFNLVRALTSFISFLLSTICLI